MLDSGFIWKTLEQPGDFFKVTERVVIEDAGDFDRVWTILQDVPGGLYCELSQITEG